jgi:hypothetical protein
MLLASLGGSSTFTYTAQADCKLVLNCSGSAGTIATSGTLVNGVRVCAMIGAFEIFAQTQEIYLGAGQSVTITTEATASCCVSAYWG